MELVGPEYLKVRLVYKKEPHVIFDCKCPLPKTFSIPCLKSEEKTFFRYSFTVLAHNDRILEVVYIERVHESSLQTAEVF